MLSFFPRGVLDEILNLIESVFEGFPSYSFINTYSKPSGIMKNMVIDDRLLLNLIESVSEGFPSYFSFSDVCS